MQYFKQWYDECMRYIFATIAGIVVVGSAYIGWTWFYETKSISIGVEEQFVAKEIDDERTSLDTTRDVVSDPIQVFSDPTLSVTPQKEVSLKVLQSEWLKRNGSNACGVIDEAPMEELLRVIEKKTPGYTLSTTTPHIQEEPPVYWFFDPEICGYTATLEWEDEAVGFEWGGEAETVLNSLGWTGGKNQLMTIGGRELEFVPAVADGALGGSNTFIHIPTVIAPYFQFLRVYERRKVSGFDELEGFYCPCSYVVSLTLSEVYPMRALESFMEDVQRKVLSE